MAIQISMYGQFIGYPVSRIFVVGFLLEPMIYQALGFFFFGSVNSTRNESHLLGFTLNTTRKWFASFETFMPQLYQWAYLARLVLIVAHRIYS